jgi:membrane-bound lytic murein transglycosylase A
MGVDDRPGSRVLRNSYFRTHPPKTCHRAIARPAIPADDLDLSGLRQAAQASLKYFGRTDESGSYTLANDVYTPEQVARSVTHFAKIVDETTPSRLKDRLARECRGYRPNQGAHFTAYYEPVLQASRVPDERFRYPLYRVPDGLTLVRLARFYPGDSRRFHGQVRDGELLPFLTRQQIDGDHMLEKRGLELAWVDDPIALFFLHIQGSGRLHLPDGQVMRVNYAANNGYSYTSVGRYMLDRNLIQSGSTSSIRSYLQSNPDTRDQILFQNKRYIFFREVALDSSEGPIGSLGVPLVAGRSIAADSRYVPPGAVLYIKTQAPVVDTEGKVAGWNSLGRFVFHHDSGAAIKGPGRADIYWGEGDRAGSAAGYMNRRGDMIVLMCGVEPLRHANGTSSSAFSRIPFPQVAETLASAAPSEL